MVSWVGTVTAMQVLLAVVLALAVPTAVMFFEYVDSWVVITCACGIPAAISSSDLVPGVLKRRGSQLLSFFHMLFIVPIVPLLISLSLNIPVDVFHFLVEPILREGKVDSTETILQLVAQLLLLSFTMLPVYHILHTTLDLVGDMLQQFFSQGRDISPVTKDLLTKVLPDDPLLTVFAIVALYFSTVLLPVLFLYSSRDVPDYQTAMAIVSCAELGLHAACLLKNICSAEKKERAEALSKTARESRLCQVILSIVAALLLCWSESLHVSPLSAVRHSFAYFLGTGTVLCFSQLTQLVVLRFADSVLNPPDLSGKKLRHWVASVLFTAFASLLAVASMTTRLFAMQVVAGTTVMCLIMIVLPLPSGVKRLGTVIFMAATVVIACEDKFATEFGLAILVLSTHIPFVSGSPAFLFGPSGAKDAKEQFRPLLASFLRYLTYPIKFAFTAVVILAILSAYQETSSYKDHMGYYGLESVTGNFPVDNGSGFSAPPREPAICSGKVEPDASGNPRISGKGRNIWGRVRQKLTQQKDGITGAAASAAFAAHDTLKKHLSSDAKEFTSAMGDGDCYPLCDQRWHGLDIMDLTIAASMSYVNVTNDAPGNQVLDVLNNPAARDVELDGKGDWVIRYTNVHSPEWVAFIDIHSPSRNVSIIAVRGSSQRFIDWLEDMSLFGESCIFDLLSIIVPGLGFWPPGFFRAFLDAYMGTIGAYFGTTENFYTPVVEYVRRSLAGSPRKVVFVGHSLGGAVAKIAGCLVSQPVVAISSPGIVNSRKKFWHNNQVVRSYNIRKFVTNVYSEGDYVPSASGKLGGAVHELYCSAGAACHSLPMTMCELWHKCPAGATGRQLVGSKRHMLC
ncbi:hypothetical protein DIPPA_05624 [Diplonema papillatum]|nr:hypothetical protein DIPPA_05624 [Diplonema papillatum]